MPPATQETSQLSDIDTEKLVKDVIFHIISQEAKRPLFKKPDILKAIGLSGRDSKVKDPIFQQAIRDLKDVFGYELKELDTKDKGKKGCYILVSTHHGPHHMFSRILNFLFVISFLRIFLIFDENNNYCISSYSFRL